MDPVALISVLKAAGGFLEVHHKTSFQCYRKTKNDKNQEVLVDILDAGPNAGAHRYSCVATREDGKSTTGNPAPSLHDALSTIQWEALDR